jgi:transcriptional regulator with XRE-family HTH domain
MDSIKIGNIISQKRKEKGITQEELANYLGVSKPAVSKWESGQSYPDILLLPVIASYFNISVDQLIGYEPQMMKEDIRKLYHRLAEKFSKKPFDQVYEECEEYIKKYFSCWQLQYQMGLLYLNHSSLAGTPEKTKRVVERTIEIFERVEKSGCDVSLARQAMQIKAYCYLCLQQPADALDILEDLNDPMIQTGSLMVKAYQMKGDKKKAIEYLQGNTFSNLSLLLSAAPDYFALYSDQPEKMESYYKLFTGLCDIFDVKRLHPSSLYSMYLVAASVFVMQGKNDRAMDVLEKYVMLAVQSNQDEFTLHNTDLFDSLQDYLKDEDIENLAPRSSRVIWTDIKNAVLNNPAFAVLEAEPRFMQIKKKLEE